MIIGVTGHRPKRIKGQEEKIKIWFENSLKNLKTENNNLVLISGMAQGVDQIAAYAALKEGVDLWCYYPYKHRLWPEEEYLVDHAMRIRYESAEYHRSCYTQRDRRIVDDCDLLLVVWDGIKAGGTWYTYNYARGMKKDILLYPWKK